MSTDRSAGSVTLDTIIAKRIREALEECAVTNEIELADHHLDYLANWATEFASDTLIAWGETWWRNPDLDRDYLYSIDSDSLERVLVLSLRGETEPGA